MVEVLCCAHIFTANDWGPSYRVRALCVHSAAPRLICIDR